jgi:hypothetical protein
MKGNISRDSHRPANRFSGVYQVQGGMVTDADLGEQASIARRRVDALGHDTACCGVPAKDGAVGLAPGAGGALVPFLREGTVYAEGVRGELRGTDPAAGGMDLYALQVDFPLRPDLPATGEHIVYADLWERMISRLEEAYLADAGLHGAETAFRSRTMTQIKIAPLDQRDAIADGVGRFPRIGTGELTVTQIDPQTIFDQCDPCADTVAADQAVPNALYRLEVVSVQGDANDPASIRIAWSSENASAMAAATVNPEDFERAGAVYELFSPVTESHLGVHHDSADARTTAFVEDLSETPSPAAAPEGGAWPYVRRWDGMATVDLGAGTVDRIGAGPPVQVANRVVTITTDTFTAELDFDGKSIVAGDYWLVELRRLGDPPIVAVQALPVGVLHNYCPLFRLVDGTPAPVTDAEERQLSFPALNDVPATHVGFTNDCAKLYGDAENVQEALTELCNISAEDIAFDPSDCPRLFDTTDNVQDALINLCKVDFGTDRILRLMMDWGVICGVIPRTSGVNDSLIRISAGAILDRAGTLGDVGDLELDLNKLGDAQIHFDSRDRMARTLAEGKLCLALAIDEGGQIEVHLSTEEAIFSPEDPTFLSTYQACLESTPKFDFAASLAALDDADRGVIDKVYLAGAKQDSLGIGARLDQAEFLTAQGYNQKVLDEYVAFTGSPDEGERIQTQWKQLEEQIDVGGATGETREIRQMQLEAAKAQVLVRTDQERRLHCLCEALLPRCPQIGKPPHLVPIACLSGDFSERDGFVIDRVCTYCCRKQALTWRTLQYFIAELRDVFADRLAEECCAVPGPQAPSKPTGFGGLVAEQIGLDSITHQVDQGFAILQGRKPPNEFQVAPEIANLSQAAASDALLGNGVEVTEVVDVADADAIAKIRDKTVGATSLDQLLATGEVRPGDKVALIVQEGVALDYIKLESGPGRYIFPTTKIGVGELASVEEKTQALAQDLAAVRAESSTLTRDLDLLREGHGQLIEEIATTTAEIEVLRSSRVDIATDLAAAREELAAIRNEQEAAAAALREVQAGLAGAAKQRDELVTSVRRNTPVTAIVKEAPSVLEALAASGISTIGELSALSSPELERIAKAAGVSRGQLAALHKNAGQFISRPIE